MAAGAKKSRRTRSESGRFWTPVCCGSCRDYSDDSAPSLEHCLQLEGRDANRGEKVYVNVMFEEEPCSFASEANPNPLFRASTEIEWISSNCHADDLPAPEENSPELSAPLTNELPATRSKRMDRRSKSAGACGAECASCIWRVPEAKSWKADPMHRRRKTNSSTSCSINADVNGTTNVPVEWR